MVGEDKQKRTYTMWCSYSLTEMFPLSGEAQKQRGGCDPEGEKYARWRTEGLQEDGTVCETGRKKYGVFRRKEFWLS